MSNQVKFYSLPEYIKKYHGGVKAKFARFFDKWPQDVTKMLKDKAEWLVVVDGDKHQLAEIKRVSYYHSS